MNTQLNLRCASTRPPALAQGQRSRSKRDGKGGLGWQLVGVGWQLVGGLGSYFLNPWCLRVSAANSQRCFFVVAFLVFRGYLFLGWVSRERETNGDHLIAGLDSWFGSLGVWTRLHPIPSLVSVGMTAVLKKGSVFTMESRSRWFEKKYQLEEVGIWRLRGYPDTCCN